MNYVQYKFRVIYEDQWAAAPRLSERNVPVLLSRWFIPRHPVGLRNANKTPTMQLHTALIWKRMKRILKKSNQLLRFYNGRLTMPAAFQVRPGIEFIRFATAQRRYCGRSYGANLMLMTTILMIIIMLLYRFIHNMSGDFYRINTFCFLWLMCWWMLWFTMEVYS